MLNYMKRAADATRSFWSGSRRWNPLIWWFGTAVGNAIGNKYASEHKTDGVFVDKSFDMIGLQLQGTVGQFDNGDHRPDIYNSSTGEVYEIKPEGQEIPAGDKAEQYVAQLGGVGLPARLGDSNAPGTKGTIEVWGMEVDYESPLPGIITYTYHNPDSSGGIPVKILSAAEAAAAGALGAAARLAPLVAF